MQDLNRVPLGAGQHCYTPAQPKPVEPDTVSDWLFTAIRCGLLLLVLLVLQQLSAVL
ncbi:hypothetical protein QU481_12020 [Crenobacter sp. SG2303]|uniref:Uncharacterized protein n=1 Tax=Crenobacter oryzisoli TaxID=3056844 RepID=A0ABT7XPA2_9NEIS|nr:hypothetical protein [Crenobacter sp. SG2303]MDN0075619.1 hypothetical protein [Crenobacter sp. SG2303]